MELEVDDQDHLVNYDNNNEDLEYESEEYTDDEADGNNNSNWNVVKRGITRLYKFRRNYGKPGGIKLSVTLDAMHRITGPNRALFSSFLGDLVREHIGLKILSWKKRYFDVDETVRKLVMFRLGVLLRNFRRKLRQTYILPNQNTPSKLNEVPAKYSAIVTKSDWVTFVNYTTTEEYQGKSAATKMARSKSLYQHTMGRGGYVYVKEKMGPLIERDRPNKKEKKSVDPTPISEHLEDTSKEVVDASAKKVSSVDINPKQCSTDQEGGSPLSVVGCEKDASIQKSTRLVTSENEMETMEIHNSVGSYKTPAS